ncbi:MAG TPA: glycosyltransferase family 4 protein [Xanthobacteraceae bacterium]|nr:glycosyltransferase family 4 protein [Xanthobacteraceae bacterium]
MPPLKILHVMRSPVGGLFRHVADLAQAQAIRGNQVGIIADATTGTLQTEAAFAALEPVLSLGLSRLPMSRHLGWSDFAAQRRVAALAQLHTADVVHGHGAKGGAYARLIPRGKAVRVYTPHGGSLHYSRSSPLGAIYLTLERALMPRTELFLFESAYGRDAFHDRVGAPSGLVRVVHNGVAEVEFEPVWTEPDAADVLFVGELRMLKGIDVLLEALSLLALEGRPASATIVGDGPDAQELQERATALNLANSVRFAGVLPARTAFAKARLLVVPSRAESLPYVVLEAAAAGLPMIATNVGGIPEIFGPDAHKLVAANDPRALADAIAAALRDRELTSGVSRRLQERVRAHFSLDSMAEQVLAAYAGALAAR